MSDLQMTQPKQSQSSPHWDTVLIANRGEIACRVIRAARALGLRTVAVFSDADREAPHVKLADVAVHLGPAEVSASYLNLEQIIRAAKSTGAGALHPGYGFFSENPSLPERCAQEGITWVGPPAEAIRLMGDKRAARVAVAARGVSVVPGYDGEDQRDEKLIEEATRIGFPLMVKASMGGGGKGMRLVHRLEDVETALTTARREAAAAFGDGELILERAVINPKHIEVQVFADEQGEVVHLGERECSLQRRHQKVIEEAPSPALSPALRAKMGTAAVEVARAVRYVGAGTVEFLLDVSSGEFYFLEMNTRIQVEHPVTEEVYGVDLVGWQLEIARGAVIPFSQEELNGRLNGHAIEARLYAEDPARDFMPQAGHIHLWRPPTGSGVRVDDGVGTEVSASYDPMLAKVIAHGPSREVARRRLMRALDELVLIGPNHNLAFLKTLLDLPAFVDGSAHTRTIDDASPPQLRTLPPSWTRALAAVAISAQLDHSQKRVNDGWGSGRRASWVISLGFDLTGYDTAKVTRDTSEDMKSEISEAQRWRITQRGEGVYHVQLLSDPLSLTGDTSTEWTLSDLTLVPTETGQSSGVLSCELEGVRHQYHAHLITARSLGERGELILLDKEGHQLRFIDLTYELEPPEGVQGSDLQVRAPMNGKVIAVQCAAHDQVKKGDTLVILEAMKLEHQLTASRDGVVSEVCVALGDQVSPQQILIELAEEPKEESS